MVSRSTMEDRLDQLEALLGRDPSEKLSEMGRPQGLALLFYNLLRRLIREGRQEKVFALLELAVKSATAGMIYLETPVSMRQALDRLAMTCARAGVWDSQPPWWQPLPPVSPLEQLWMNLKESPPLYLPSDKELTEAFAERPEAPRYLSLHHAMDPARAAIMFNELEKAFASADISFRRAGVGEDARTSELRTDYSAYTTGLEPVFLKNCPNLAVTVQWCMLKLAELLEPTSTKKLLAQQAMVARYPAPSRGYYCHTDNPGGEKDIGRARTLVIYLNPADQPGNGGELALWGPGVDIQDPPTAFHLAEGGTAVLFDSRAIPHMVCPLGEGPPRWALSYWVQDNLPNRAELPLPSLSLTDALFSAEPPKPQNNVLFHQIREPGLVGIVSRPLSLEPVRVGMVSTVYKADALLENWCAHHLDLGMDHLVLVFDHLSQPEETNTAQKLRQRWGEDRLTIWDGEQLLAQNWPTLPAQFKDELLVRHAHTGSGSSAVCARQCLNASAVLHAIKNEQLPHLDWLLHLDADERFLPESRSHGGETVQEHFACLLHAGIFLVRYANHELVTEVGQLKPRFKINPLVAKARMGNRPFTELMAAITQEGARPFFQGYTNGKSAVAVKSGNAAAGVHGWSTSDPGQNGIFLYGPSILHFHAASAETFCSKYLNYAQSPATGLEPLFPPLPIENAALALIATAKARGLDQSGLEQHLTLLYQNLQLNEDAIKRLEKRALIRTPRLSF